MSTPSVTDVNRTTEFDAGCDGDGRWVPSAWTGTIPRSSVVASGGPASTVAHVEDTG